MSMVNDYDEYKPGREKFPVKVGSGDIRMRRCSLTAGDEVIFFPEYRSGTEVKAVRGTVTEVNEESRWCKVRHRGSDGMEVEREELVLFDVIIVVWRGGQRFRLVH